MQIAKKAILIISALIFGFNQSMANPENKTDTCEILLIGSSYFNYNNLRSIVENLAENSNNEIYIEMHGQNGLYLSDHASSSSTQAKIYERDWEYVFLQGVGSLMAYPEHFTDHPVYPALVTLRDKIYTNCESTKMVFCMPWAFEDGMTWYQNWTDTYADMQHHIYDNTLQYSEEIGFQIAPVGWSWFGVLEDKNYPLHYLHMSDWNHPSVKGSYLMACVIYSTAFLESSLGNPYHGGLPEEEAIYFQALASDTVLNNLELWNITTLSIENPGHASQAAFHLYQNHPNPVTIKTTIRYSIHKNLRVNLIIFDAMGTKVCTIVDAELEPGNYQVEFDVKGLSSGIYYYRMKAGEFQQTRSMVLY